MKRPFAVIGFSALAAMMAAVFIDSKIAFVCSFLSMAVVFALFLAKRVMLFKQYKIVSAVLITVSLALFLYGSSASKSYEPYQALNGVDAQITGKVQGYPESRNGKVYYKVKVTEVLIKGEKLEAKPFVIRLSASKPINCEPYDEINTKVKFFSFNEKFGFSSKTSYWSKGIVLSAYMREFEAEVTPIEKKPIIYYFEKFSKHLGKELRFILPKEEAALTNAMIIGDMSNVSDDVDFAFRKTASTHLLVVSGMHMTLISALALAILSAFRVPKQIANIIAIFMLVAFMMMTGMQASIIRSGIMATVFLLGQIIGRESDSMNTLGFSVFIMCLFQPQIGGDIGFILSVFATLGIIKLSKPIENKLFSWRNKIKKPKPLKMIITGVTASLSVSLAATLLVLPVQIYLFGGFSITGPITTLILSLPMSFMLYFAFFALLLSAIFAPLAAPLAFLTGLCAKFTIWFVKAMSDFGGYVGVMESFGVPVLCAVLVLVAIVLFLKKGKAVRVAAIVMSVVIVCVSAMAQTIKYVGSLTIAVVNMGESPTVLIMQGKTCAVISMQGYNSGAVRDVIMQNNITEVQGILLTDDSRETLECAKQITDRYSVNEIVIKNDVYIPRTVKEDWPDIHKTVFDNTANPDWLLDVNWSIDENEVSFIFADVNVVLEIGDGNAGNCDILITNNSSSLINSAFTVLLSDDIIIPNDSNKGTYLIAKEYKTVYIDIFKDGKTQLRRAG